MASQGPYLPASGADGGGGGDVWSTPSNVTLADGNVAFCDYTDFETSNVLEITDFGFAIPVGATITDIAVELYSPAGFNDGFGPNGQVGVNGGAFTQFITEGGGWMFQGDGLWGATWTPAEINDSFFGLTVQVFAGLVSGVNEAQVDSARITVTYTPFSPPVAGAPPLSPVTMIGLGRRS